MKQAFYLLDLTGLERLLGQLRSRGFEVIGPRLRAGSIHQEPIGSLEDLPQGYTDQQRPGHYAVTQSGTSELFHYNLGPDSLKSQIHPAEQSLFTARKEDKGFSITSSKAETPKRAILGARACELEAAKKLLRVHSSEGHLNHETQRRRDNLFIIGVDCSKAGGNCFCLSLGQGPEVDEGADLALSELIRPEPLLLVRALSKAGQELIKGLQLPEANQDQISEAHGRTEQVKAKLNPKLKTLNLKENLQAKMNERVWADVAKRCLGCGNCTMVCPTCFCVTYDDRTNLAGDQSERVQRWDSCFSLDYSYIHGGYARKETAYRYRHWITHKLANWVDQFGELGCTGCGRCITWCPVGIDITEEADKASQFQTPS